MFSGAALASVDASILALRSTVHNCSFLHFVLISYTPWPCWAWDLLSLPTLLWQALMERELEGRIDEITGALIGMGFRSTKPSDTKGQRQQTSRLRSRSGIGSDNLER